METTFIIIMLVNLFVLIVCILMIMNIFGKNRGREPFYIVNEILYINNLLYTKKVLFSNIACIEFSHGRLNCRAHHYRGKIVVYTKNSKKIKRYFQTSKFVLFPTEEMILEEINKITPTLKKYSIPYRIAKQENN